MGITEYDFQLPRTREELRILFERIGFTYKVGKFNAMFNRAKEITGQQGVGAEMASVRAFISAFNELNHIE
jgi:hypothetical protein